MSTTFKSLLEEQAMMNRIEIKMQKFRPYPKTIILPESLWAAEINNIDLYEYFATQGWTPRIVQRVFPYCAYAVLTENLGEVFHQMSEVAGYQMRKALCCGFKSPRVPGSHDLPFLGDGLIRFAKRPRAKGNR